MKDTSHHLKQVQRKVLQAIRKETRVRYNSGELNNRNYLIPANSKATAKRA